MALKDSKKRREYNKTHQAKYAPMRAAYAKTLAGKFTFLKGRSKQRGLECTLTFEQYTTLVSNPCFYCGGELPERGHGVDRINSDIGYVPGNVRPCCTHCNLAKSSMTDNEFKEWLLRVMNHWVN